MPVTRFALGFALLSVTLGACGGKVSITNEGTAGTGAGATTGGGPALGGSGGILPGGGGLPAGGGGFSGAGGIPPGGGGAGGAPCSSGCPSFKLAGLIDMPACCAGPVGACGATVSDIVSQLIMIAPGCYELGAPGSMDPSCPSIAFTDPVSTKPVTWAGCCRSSGGCGVLVDLTSQAGPNFGCADISGSMPKQACGASGDCNACIQQQCQVELAACGANHACVLILECLQNCIDQGCVDKCVIVNPNGAQVFKQLELCVTQQCSPECQ